MKNKFQNLKEILVFQFFQIVNKVIKIVVQDSNSRVLLILHNKIKVILIYLIQFQITKI